MCFASNNISALWMHNCNHNLWWNVADRFHELSSSDLNMKANLVIKSVNNYYWSRLWQNIMICQCLRDQLFASASWLLRSHFEEGTDIFCNCTMVPYHSRLIQNIFILKDCSSITCIGYRLKPTRLQQTLTNHNSLISAVCSI